MNEETEIVGMMKIQMCSCVRKMNQSKMNAFLLRRIIHLEFRSRLHINLSQSVSAIDRTCYWLYGHHSCRYLTYTR